MPQNVTDISAFTSPIVEMADADPLGPQYARTAIEGLANRTAYIVNGLANSTRGSIVVQSVSTTQINVGPGYVWLTDGTTTRWGLFAATSVTPVVVETGAGVVANTWYYVYIYPDIPGFGLTFVEVSKTGPDLASGLVHKNGDPTRLYVGCFRTDPGATIRPFTMHRGRCVYRSVDANSILTGSATSWTGQSAAALVPPHARVANLALELTAAAGAGAHFAQLRIGGDTSGPMETINAAASTINSLRILREVNSSQVFDYQVANAGDSLAVSVAGFEE